MDRKQAIVTGANSGMGLATTIGLIEQGYDVIMACRSEERGTKALHEVEQRGGSGSAQLMILDLASINSIHQFAQEFQQRFTHLDVLVNNAGVFPRKKQLTADGFETITGVNHLGHFLLTLLLINQLRKAEQGRVINVSSVIHKWGKINFADPYQEKSYSRWRGYAQSKLANVLFTRELNDRLQHTKIAVNAVHPGSVYTNFGLDREAGEKKLFNRLVKGKLFNRLVKPFFLTAAKGAETAIHLATSSEVAEISGEYFYRKKIAPISKQAQSKELAEQLWSWSEQEVGFTWEQLEAVSDSVN